MKTNDRFEPLRNEEGLFEDQGGGAAGAVAEVEEPVETPPEAAPPPKADSKEIADAIREGFSQVVPPQQAAPQMSEEEIARALKVWQPDNKFASQFREAIGADDAAPLHQAILSMRDGLMQQAATYSNYLVQMQREQLMKELAPVLESVREQRRQQTVGRFLTKYPSLKPFERALPLVAKQLAESGANYAGDEGKAFESLANATAEYVKTFNPEFSLGQPATAGSGGVKPASVSFGSGGGGGSAPARKASADIWD